MANHKHLSLSQRVSIEQLLNARYSFKAIGRELSKDCTTVSKEVKNHIQFKKSGCMGKAFNDCANRYTCSLTSLCAKNNCGNKLCKDPPTFQVFHICIPLLFLLCRPLWVLILFFHTY